MLSRSWIVLLLMILGVSLLGAGCPTQSLPGDPTAGEATFNQKCIGCHPVASALSGHQNQIFRNMGRVNVAMAGVTLTAQEVADLKSYLVPP
jgi:hypothetical protein